MTPRELEDLLDKEERDFQARKRREAEAAPVMDQIDRLTADGVPATGLRMSPDTFQRFANALDARMFGGGAAPVHALLATPHGWTKVIAVVGVPDGLVEVVP